MALKEVVVCSLLKPPLDSMILDNFLRKVVKKIVGLVSEDPGRSDLLESVSVTFQ